MYRIGIDLGGTSIKGGIVDKDGRIVCKKSVPTGSSHGSAHVLKNIVGLIKSLIGESGLGMDQFAGVGIGSPGMIDSKRGVVAYSNNLGWSDVDVCGAIGDETELPVKIANDANAAALGEYEFGGGKDYSSIVMFTLGTGVGGGIIIDGAMLEGNGGAGAEIGHAVIIEGGEPCTCGRRGCMEAYCSATALIRDTRRAMEADKFRSGKMWTVVDSPDKVTGKTAFDAADLGDAAAKAVLDEYINHLATGIVNIVNIIRPEAVLLGGGIAASSHKLLDELQSKVNASMYGGDRVPCLIKKATLGNDAGLLGAAALIEIEN